MSDLSFQEWFCLKDRATFTVDPKVTAADAELYFGRQNLRDKIKKQMARSFTDPQVPKMMFFGAYGSGKTQTLYNMAWDLEQHKPASCKGTPHVVHLDIEVESKSGARSWHLQMAEALEMATVKAWLAELFDKSPDFDKAIEKLSADSNIRKVLKHIRGTGDTALLSWRWLSGQGLGLKELNQIEVTRQMGDVGIGDLVSAMIAIGNLAQAVGKRLIFFMDEMEALQNVKQGDAAESWHDYLRKLSETSNSSVGYIIGFNAATLDDAPRILVREDVLSRMGKQNLIELETLAAPENVKAFIHDMLRHMIDAAPAAKLITDQGLPTSVDVFPFSEAAFDKLSEYACQDPTKSTPRNIIKAINECALAGWDTTPQKRVIDEGIVDEVAPVIFG